MTSSKKQRGKFSKNRAAASNKFAPAEITIIPDPNRENTITLLYPQGDTQLYQFKSNFCTVKFYRASGLDEREARGQCSILLIL